jgi:hypothetical protein
VTFLTKVHPYAVITLDLGTPRTSSSQGPLSVQGLTLDTWIANSLLVNALSAGATLTIAMGEDADEITAASGLKSGGIVFTDLVYTNAAQVGKSAEILVAYI